ncbi:hypothetical protein DO64_4784 [Burkholderia pseudomallei]|nr:hypothetical protein DO64_4784 [Burkholderia pseudomallei]
MRADEFDRVALLQELSCPVMGARARFHPYSAWRKPENKFRQLCAADAASQNKLARSIHAVHWKTFFARSMARNRMVSMTILL